MLCHAACWTVLVLMVRSLSFAQPLHALQHQVTATSDISKALLLGHIQVAHWMRQHDMSVVGCVVQL
jgi:hypothetical protein